MPRDDWNYGYKSPDVLGSLPDDKHEKSINHLEIDKE